MSNDTADKHVIKKRIEGIQDVRSYLLTLKEICLNNGGYGFAHAKEMLDPMLYDASLKIRWILEETRVGGLQLPGKDLVVFRPSQRKSLLDVDKNYSHSYDQMDRWLCGELQASGQYIKQNVPCDSSGSTRKSYTSVLVRRVLDSTSHVVVSWRGELLSYFRGLGYIFLLMLKRWGASGEWQEVSFPGREIYRRIVVLYGEIMNWVRLWSGCCCE
ncbi:hypothetical protein Tco_0127354 [Tanacetum coccineum]